MTRTTDKENQGVIVTGGTLSARNMAVGKNAKISNREHSNNRVDTVLQELLAEISRLIDNLEKSHVESEKIEAAKLAKTELEKDSPNFFIAKTMLLPLLDAIKAIGSVAGIVISIKKLLGIVAP
ncbi:MAG: hypothetical protein HW380_2242 [Magnetococcales bacterium]|nr:hypothetical protein [Magnetococcales bacterium]HIJ85469.1 hypothetical protein [Magnetococcales bacterium]